MISFIHCVRRFAPTLPLRGTSLREDGLREATDAVLTRYHHHNQPISTVWASIRNSPRLYLKNRRDLSKVQGQLIAAYFGSYLKTKGKNLATKEDLKDITTTVESIKSDLETHKALRLSALDRRLDAHQQAYTLWRKLVHVSNDPKKATESDEHVTKCQDWWNENCLYLDSESREAFRLAYLAAHSRPPIMASGHGDSMRENFEIVIAAGQKIVAGAALPPLNADKEDDTLNEDPTSR